MENFYQNGLRFKCRRCSKCCRHSGFVFLSESDLTQLCGALSLSRNAVLQNYCKTVAGNGEMRLSLVEHLNGDCVFYDNSINGCRIYDVRPLQCKLYPFWEHMVCDEKKWQAEKQTCPGLDCGRLYSPEEIEGFIVRRRQEPIIK